MKTTKMSSQEKSSESRMQVPKSITKIVLLSLVFLSFTLSSFSKSNFSESSTKERETTEIRKQLFSQIQFPDFMREDHLEEVSVNVLFQVEKNGSIKVVRTDSSNEHINKFILAEMEHAKLDSLGVNEENIYKINIRFKLL